MRMKLELYKNMCVRTCIHTHVYARILADKIYKKSGYKSNGIMNAIRVNRFREIPVDSSSAP